jgi:hypothetical protein
LAAEATLLQYQNLLLGRGVPLFWWSDVLGSPFWRHIQMVGVRGIFVGDAGSLAFRPTDPLDDADKPGIEAKLGQGVPWPAGQITRGQAAQIVATQMGWLR